MNTQMEAIDILARTIWAEARGEGKLGMGCVANVIINRFNSKITWWGSSIIGICIKPWQFSCWNSNDPNREKLLKVTTETKSYRDALEIAQLALTTGIVDYTFGADHYFDKRMPEYPKWADNQEPVTEIGHHVFYNLYNRRTMA